MTPSPGSRLGPYEIVSLLGEGGMGRVYRARDRQLDRDVAIKILPEEFAADPDRPIRFEREARSLAALNHPHIAQVYSLESSGPARAIVMELVEGEDLAERIARGPLPPDEAIAIGRQIADALESAHGAGIVHRDLKPANVKVRPDGTVKVLDFGLARSSDEPGATSSARAIANSPTFTSPAMTQHGVILGTVAYMAPEQARGKVVDRRADLWAFGCVLFEMLTASPAFEGETITDVLSAVVSKDPDWSKLPPATPPAVARLIRRCLRKDARTRLQSAGDARIELEDALSEPPAPGAPMAAARKVGWLPALALMTAGAAIALVANAFVRPRAAPPADPPVMRYTIPLPSTFSQIGAPTISPDGRWIAITATGRPGRALGIQPSDVQMAIWLRPMDGDTFRPVAGTEQSMMSVWSPDSRELLFFARGGGLYRVAITGGTPARVAEIASNAGWAAAAWGADGTILLNSDGAICRVAAAGGALTQLTTVDPALNVAHTAPSWLPGDRFLFTEIASGTNVGEGVGGLMLQSLANGTPRRLMDGRTFARYAAQRLLVGRMTVTGASVGTISAHHFDPERGTVEQPGVVLASDVHPFFGVSDTGVLVYREADAAADHRLEWADARGQPTGEGFDVSGSGAFNLSRDGQLVAFQEGNAIMVRDLARGVTSLAVQGPGVLEPILSPDGRRIAYSKILPPQTGIAIRPTAGGPEEMVFPSPDLTLVEDWSRDGRFLLGIQSSGRLTPNRGVIIPLEGDRTPVLFADLPSGAALDEPRFSPDGKWVVYNASDNGRQEVFLTPVPPTQERWQLSTDGGAQGRWSPDGSSVYYLSASGQLMHVTLSGSRPPQIGRPKVLFDTGLEMAANVDQYAPGTDGTRFLLRRPRGTTAGVNLHVIVNWPALANR